MCTLNRQPAGGGDRWSGCGDLFELRLPASVREALRLARSAHPDREISCVTYHTKEDGRETFHLGPRTCADLHARDVIVLSVEMTETSADRVRTWSHTLITRARPREAALG